MRGSHLIIAGFALALASCGSEQSGSFTTEDGTEGTYTVEGEDGDATIRIAGENGGEVAIDAGDDVSADLPEGFSVYPGARVVSSATMQQTDGSGALVIMESKASPEELIEFYRKQAEGAGITISTEITASGNLVIAGEGKQGETFSFNAQNSGGATTGQLLIGRVNGG